MPHSSARDDSAGGSGVARAVADFRAVFGDGASDTSSASSPRSASCRRDSTPGLLPHKATTDALLKETVSLSDGCGGSNDAGSLDGDFRSDAPSAYDPDAELLSTQEDDVPEPAVEGCGPFPVNSLEDYCAYLFLSGQCSVTEASYDIFWRFRNVGRPAHNLLRDKTTIRRVVAPAIREQWCLSIEGASVPATREAGGMMQVAYILPNTHVKRAIAFRGTEDPFFATTGSAADADLNPEYCDSPMHQKRCQGLCPHLQ